MFASKQISLSVVNVKFDPWTQFEYACDIRTRGSKIAILPIMRVRQETLPDVILSRQLSLVHTSDIMISRRKPIVMKKKIDFFPYSTIFM